MKLFVAPVAPNPTRVCLYIAEKNAGGAHMDVTEVRVSFAKGEQNSEEHLSRNYFGRLPVLEFSDGSYLGESLAIIEYLEECYPEPQMIGHEPQVRARVRELERVAELGVLQPIARIVHAMSSPLGLPPNPEIAAHFRPTLDKNLRYLDETLADGRPFVAGSACTIADCTLAAAFQFARFAELDAYSSYENIRRWDESYRGRPAAKAVLIR